MTFVDLLCERYKERHPRKYEMGDGTHHGLSLDLNMCFIYANTKGDVFIKPTAWVRVGNVHEPDILDRLDKAIKVT